MTDLLRKLTDMNGLKAASTMLALPMLCVAYILQNGAQIGWDGTVWFSIPETLTQPQQVARLLLIFLCKSLWISFFGMMAYGLLVWIHHASNFPLLLLLAVLFLALGVFGLFGREAFPVLNSLSPFWFYCSVVWALFFHGMHEQLEERT